jgi:hypothetical protein
MLINYTITKSDFLYRRIPKDNPYCWKEINGTKIPSSANFKTNKGEDGLSVNIATLTTPEKVIAKYENRPLGEKKEIVGKEVPFGRMGKAEDLVGMVKFLASEESEYIVSQTYNVDGGNWMN